MKISKAAFWIVVIVVVLCFLYVWPGVWRFQYYRYGLIRIDRLTGAHQDWIVSEISITRLSTPSERWQFLHRWTSHWIDAYANVKPHWHTNQDTCHICSNAQAQARQEAKNAWKAGSNTLRELRKEEKEEAADTYYDAIQAAEGTHAATDALDDEINKIKKAR